MSKSYYKGQIQERIDQLNKIDRIIRQINKGSYKGFDSSLNNYLNSFKNLENVLSALRNDDGYEYANDGLTGYQKNIDALNYILRNYCDVNYRQQKFLEDLRIEKSHIEAQGWALQREYNANKDHLDVIGIKMMEMYKVNLR